MDLSGVVREDDGPTQLSDELTKFLDIAMPFSYNYEPHEVGRERFQEHGFSYFANSTLNEGNFARLGWCGVCRSGTANDVLPVLPDSDYFWGGDWGSANVTNPNRFVGALQTSSNSYHYVKILHSYFGAPIFNHPGYHFDDGTIDSSPSERNLLSIMKGFFEYWRYPTENDNGYYYSAAELCANWGCDADWFTFTQAASYDSTAGNLFDPQHYDCSAPPTGGGGGGGGGGDRRRRRILAEQTAQSLELAQQRRPERVLHRKLLQTTDSVSTMANKLSSSSSGKNVAVYTSFPVTVLSSNGSLVSEDVLVVAGAGSGDHELDAGNGAQEKKHTEGTSLHMDKDEHTKSTHTHTHHERQETWTWGMVLGVFVVVMIIYGCLYRHSDRRRHGLPEYPYAYDEMTVRDVEMLGQQRRTKRT